MPACVLTTDFMATLPTLVPSSGTIIYADTEIRGFLLELRASGGATFYFRYRDVDGKQRFYNIGRVNKVSLADARNKAHEIRVLVSEGGDPKLERFRFLDIPTLEQFASERYLPYARTRKRSWQNDDTFLRVHILPLFGHLRMNRISRSDIVSFHHQLLEKGYAPGTCNRMLVLLKFIYNCAIRWDVLPAKCNPCQGVEPFEDNGARERYLSQEEVQKLFAELDTNPNVQVGQVIRLLLYTGARKREILDAKWEEIDFDKGLLTIPSSRSKSKKPRHIPLCDAAMKILQELPRQQDMPWVFFNPKTGKPPVSIFNAWNTIRKKLGMPELRLHDLRHSYASFLVNAGRSLYEVQKLLGHHDPKVTMRYAHLSPASMLDAVNVVGEVLATSSGRSLGRKPSQRKTCRSSRSVNRLAE
ncbi:MAG: tyrosine-type recombinase/integrase [Desulfuromonadaceae bacterium]|jgi:integrase|nr:tyrosine-type recombinase/integrase [Desulfuromonadaceae bacterium]